MRDELEALGWQVEVVNLGEGFLQPTAKIRAAAGAALAALPAGRPIVVDGLALGVLPEAAEVLRRHYTLVALVHHPLALESGLDPVRCAQLRASERAALAAARHVVATSDTTARLLISDYDVCRQ